MLVGIQQPQRGLPKPVTWSLRQSAAAIARPDASPIRERLSALLQASAAGLAGENECMGLTDANDRKYADCSTAHDATRLLSHPTVYLAVGTAFSRQEKNVSA